MHFVGLFFVFIIENARSKKQKNKKQISQYFLISIAVNNNNNNNNNNNARVLKPRSHLQEDGGNKYRNGIIYVYMKGTPSVDM